MKRVRFIQSNDQQKMKMIKADAKSKASYATMKRLQDKEVSRPVVNIFMGEKAKSKIQHNTIVPEKGNKVILKWCLTNDSEERLEVCKVGCDDE